jgi:hypothetical protein
MRNRSLLGHELLCLQLKSFYGVQACSPSLEAPNEKTHLSAKAKLLFEYPL